MILILCLPRSQVFPGSNFCLGMRLIGRGLLLWQEAHICSGELIGTPEWKWEYGGRWRGGWRGGWPESLTMKFITNKVNILLTVQYKRHKIWNYLWLKYSLFSRLPLCQQNSRFFLLWKTGQGVQGRMGWGSLALRPLGGGECKARDTGSEFRHAQTWQSDLSLSQSWWERKK